MTWHKNQWDTPKYKNIQVFPMKGQFYKVLEIKLIVGGKDTEKGL